jgi:hypothetical protein
MESRSTALAYGNDFLGRSNHPIDSCLLGQFSQVDDLLRYRPDPTYLFEVLFVQAGQNGNGQDYGLRPIQLFGYIAATLRCCAHHFHSAGGMKVEHCHPQFNGFFRRPGDCVGNIMQFKVEKNIPAFFLNRFYRLWTEGGEKLQSNLKQPYPVFQQAHETPHFF